MLSFKDWMLNEDANVTVIDEWKFIGSTHAFERLAQRTDFTFAKQSDFLKKIRAKLNGLRIGDYGFQSKSYDKIAVCEVNPLKKTVKLITVLSGGMKLKQGTSKIITENVLETIQVD